MSAAPVLLCFDGSDHSRAAISQAGTTLAHRTAVVLTVWEPVASWAPYDPATMLDTPVARLASHALGLDEDMRDLARERMEGGIKLATDAGFRAEGRVEKGKPWRAICQVADELDASTIVVGARGLGGVQSALLGSVSSAVVHHTKRPVLVVPHHEEDSSSGR
jgi:nucleotide-binding universal stress UspA family protein